MAHPLQVDLGQEGTMRHIRQGLGLIALIFLAAACGGVGTTASDAGTGDLPDAGTADADGGDAAAVDGGVRDGGGADAGRPDAGLPDAGQPDGGALDAGSADGGSAPDAGLPDGGADDGGSPGPLTGCSACHGDATTPAPPRDLAGNTDPAARGVGAHRSHLTQGSWWHRDGVCSDCHLVPQSVDDPGHIDTPLPAEVTFGAVATAGGATPTWDGTTCAGSWCHGGALTGGTHTTPTWTGVGTYQAVCGTCHGIPPAAPHPQRMDCGTCHPTMAKDRLAFVDPTRHIDGILDVVHPPGWADPGQHGTAVKDGGLSTCQSCHGADLAGGSVGVSCNQCHDGWQTDCTFCHGGQGDQTGAPPFGVHGQTDPTDLAVGAHASHVRDTAIHLAWDCDRCHVKPASASSPGHLDGDGRAEVVFDALDPGATYDRATGTCANLYCHGNGWSRTGTMVWNAPRTLGCADCHADETVPRSAFDMSGQHYRHVVRQGLTCDACHADTVDASKHITGLALHVDGVPEVRLKRGGTYDPASQSCRPACHGRERW